MRAYRLHTASWSRIVTHRVRRPDAIAERLASRRRPERAVPADGQLVLLACNHRIDPRTGSTVDRRELLDRIIEALSIPAIDGVIASADLLEELTLLNVLERRLAFCATAADRNHRSIGSTTIAASHFDGAQFAQRWSDGRSVDRSASERWCLAADVAELAAHSLPAILDLSLADLDGRSDFDTSWDDWIRPIHETAADLATGAGIWMSVPAISGLDHLAEATGFPILVRDTDIPILPSAWEQFFGRDLPLTIRGMVPGVSALFPLEGSVAEATAQIARAVRARATGARAA